MAGRGAAGQNRAGQGGAGRGRTGQEGTGWSEERAHGTRRFASALFNSVSSGFVSYLLLSPRCLSSHLAQRRAVSPAVQDGRGGAGRGGASRGGAGDRLTPQPQLATGRATEQQGKELLKC